MITKRTNKNITMNLSHFGNIELRDAIKILQKCVEKFPHWLGVKAVIRVHPNYGFVCLSDDVENIIRYNSRSEKLEPWVTTPIGNISGFIDEIMSSRHYSDLDVLDKDFLEKWKEKIETE